MGMSLHEGACVSVIESQGSDEQQAKWVHRLKKYEFIGCYAQTELGHGSNVQGLMTTATFNPANDEFIIDSNGLEGTKWWIGALGVMVGI